MPSHLLYADFARSQKRLRCSRDGLAAYTLPTIAYRLILRGDGGQGNA